MVAALVRHGEYRQLPDTPSAHQPFPLTPEGESQARLAADALRTAMETGGWTLSPEVHSSQMLRAWQTARIIVEQLASGSSGRLRLMSFDALAERGLGSAANLTITQIETVVHEDPRFPDLPEDWKSNSRFRVPLQGAESLLEAGERVAAHISKQLEALTRKAQSDTMQLFVGHGAAFRHAAYHLGILAYEQIAQLSMYHAQPVFLEYLPGQGWHHIGGVWKVRDKQGEYTD
jgi:2,3-bisphosphoglycerate-dependent phosphoglycerate mutase